MNQASGYNLQNDASLVVMWKVFVQYSWQVKCRNRNEGWDFHKGKKTSLLNSTNSYPFPTKNNAGLWGWIAMAGYEGLTQPVLLRQQLKHETSDEKQ